MEVINPMKIRNPFVNNDAHYSWNSMLSLVTWGILFYMIYVQVNSLIHYVGTVSLGISQPLIIIYTVCILLAGIAVTLIRRRMAYQVTFSSFLVSLLIQLFVVAIASNLIYWKFFVFAILGEWLIIEVFRSLILRNGSAFSNLISLCLLLFLMANWNNPQPLESRFLTIGLMCFWGVAEWLHTQQSTIVRLFQQTFGSFTRFGKTP